YKDIKINNVAAVDFACIEHVPTGTYGVRRMFSSTVITIAGIRSELRNTVYHKASLVKLNLVLKTKLDGNSMHSKYSLK
ncbi:MAG: hypothetical protein WA941_07940, partial [Nitrososphaeraceae archaeon]